MTSVYNMVAKQMLVYLMLVILIGMSGGCQAPATVLPPTTAQPEVALSADLLLTREDMRTLDRYSWARSLPPYSRLENWPRSGALDHLQQVYQTLDNRVSVVQHILQFATHEQAEQFWQVMKDARINRALTRYDVVPLLSVEELPPLHADNVLLRCETYPGYQGSDCEVRLRYQSVYTSVSLSVNPPTVVSLDNLYDLVAIVDERMRPFWGQ
jgi:hypothetical protein